MASSAYACVAVHVSEIGPHSNALGDVIEAWSTSVPVAEPGPVKRPPNEKVKRPVTEPLIVSVTFVSGVNVPSAWMPNRVDGRTVVAGLVNVPLGEHGMLIPKVMFMM